MMKICGILMLALATAATAGPTHVVGAQGWPCLNLRLEPDGPSLACLEPGAQVELLETQGEQWGRARLVTGEEGWVAMAYLRPVVPEALVGGPSLGPLAAAAPQSPASDSPPHQEATGSSVGPGDVLRLQILGLPDYDTKTRVSASGALSVPMLGKIQVAGLSAFEIEEKLAALLIEKNLLRNPQVLVFVEELVSHGVSIQGAVETPGIYQMAGRSTLLDLLAQAGGLAGGRDERFAGKIYIVRYGSAGEEERLEIDGERLLNRADVSLNVTLRAGDIVIVPHQEVARVYVSGAVARPGPVEFRQSEGLTVLQAFAAAGGPSQRAHLANVTILRKHDDGSEQRIAVDFKKISRGKEADPPLQAGDLLIVPEWYL